jgi:hypothetical protein
MNATTQATPDHPMVVAWKAYQETDEYKNAKHWASQEKHLEGSLWVIFMQGWEIGQHELRDCIERLETDLARADSLIACHAYTIDQSPPDQWPSGSILRESIGRHSARPRSR